MKATALALGSKAESSSSMIANRAKYAPHTQAHRWHFASEPSGATGEIKLQRTLATALANHPPICSDGCLGGS
jgi:hypothetical protein